MFSKLATATTADQTEMEAESTRSGSDRTFSTRETGGGQRGLEYVGQAIFLTKEGKWREAGEIAAKGNAGAIVDQSYILQDGPTGEQYMLAGVL